MLGNVCGELMSYKECIKRQIFNVLCSYIAFAKSLMLTYDVKIMSLHTTLNRCITCLRGGIAQGVPYTVTISDTLCFLI
jgi:hypothetical protein